MPRHSLSVHSLLRSCKLASDKESRQLVSYSITSVMRFGSHALACFGLRRIRYCCCVVSVKISTKSWVHFQAAGLRPPSSRRKKLNHLV